MPDNIQSVNLSQITNQFDVRIKLDEDRVVQFAGMYESGMELPPVELVKLAADAYAYIDGRHRGAARAYLNLENVMAIVRNGNLKDNPALLFTMALRANWGGAKPPSRVDIEHTILRMLECGVTQTDVRQSLSFLPSGALKAYISCARGVIMKRRISRAVSYISEGIPLAEAAKKVGLKDDQPLRDAVLGKKRKFGAGSMEDEFCTALKSYITRELKRANMGIGLRVGGMLRKVEDGEISPRAAELVVKAWSDNLRQTAVRATDWRARVNALAISHSKAESAPE